MPVGMQQILLFSSRSTPVIGAVPQPLLLFLWPPGMVPGTFSLALLYFNNRDQCVSLLRNETWRHLSPACLWLLIAQGILIRRITRFAVLPCRQPYA